MSVVAVMKNAKNELDEGFSIPIASKYFFNSYWKKAIEELQLEFLSRVEQGLEFTKEELPHIIEELHKVTKWKKGNLREGEKKVMEIRVGLLIEKLPEAFEDESNTVFIG
ncbi:hypothetical protein [Anaerosporobacter sp.]|uniref:hypothetical protein n=1 Tax=Anaerosporobacter sp. TaxID=1872529 RepID=UPI00286F166D|nr:hypothetical protein [Anaerosporobacter sp.]